MDFQPIIAAVFAAYFLTLIAIAVFRANRMREMSDYVLAGRRMSSFTSALSASSSTTSGWTMLVFPALAFSEGTVHLWTTASLVLGAWFTWTILGKRLRRYTIFEESLTLPDFFEKRFGDGTGTLRTVSAALTIFFIMFYVNSGLIGGAKLLETIFGLEHNPSVLITLVAVSSYTFIGGFMAVSRTDVFQAMVMLVSFTILPLTLIFATAEPFTGTGQPLGFLNPLTDAAGDPITAVFVLSTAGWGLGAFGSQRILQRFMAIESEEKMNTSRNIGVTWIVFIFSFGFLLGLVARPALMEMGLMGELTGAEGLFDPERVYFVAAEAFFLPVFTGLLLTGVVAAIMSTGDSQLLLGSAIATEDLPLMKRAARRLEHTYVLAASGRVWLGPVPAAGDRRGCGGLRYRRAGLDSQRRSLRLGRHGGGIRADHHPCALLAQVQLLGRARIHHRGRRDGQRLAAQLGGPLGNVRHGDRNCARLHRGDGRGDRRHTAHLSALG